MNVVNNNKENTEDQFIMMDIGLGPFIEVSNLYGYSFLTDVLAYVSSSTSGEEEYKKALDVIDGLDTFVFDTSCIKKQLVAIHNIRNRDCRWRYSDVRSDIYALADEYHADNPYFERDDTEEDLVQWLQGYLRIDLDVFSDEERAELIKENLESHRAEMLELIHSLSDWRQNPDAENFPVSELATLGDYAGIEVDTETSDIVYLTHMMDRVFRSLLETDDFNLLSLADTNDVEYCVSMKDRIMQAAENKSIRIAMTPAKAKALGIRCIDPHFVMNSFEIKTDNLSPAAKWVVEHITATRLIDEITDKNDVVCDFGLTRAERDRLAGKSEKDIEALTWKLGGWYSETPIASGLCFPLFGNDMNAPEDLIEETVEKYIRNGAKYFHSGDDCFEI